MIFSDLIISYRLHTEELQKVTLREECDRLQQKLTKVEIAKDLFEERYNIHVCEEC